MKMKTRHPVLALCLLLTAVLVASPFATMAQQVSDAPACVAPDQRTDLRPGTNETPTEVTLGLRVVDLLEINDVDQTITIDVAMRMQWVDQRLSGLAGCKIPISTIWFPKLIMKNSGRMFHRWPETVSIDEGGKVTYLQRVSGTFAGYQQLQDFPFDNQVISLWFYPLDWSVEKLVFRDDADFTGVAPPLNISDWSINSVTGGVIEADFEAFGQIRSGFLLEVNASRHVGYYIWKVMLPVGLIVVMSWCVFWINPRDFGTQLGFSASSVLTMIAFIFATTSLLPKLGYFTVLDRFVGTATIFVFIALLQSLVTGYLASKDQKLLAVRIDLVSRILFPLVFFGLCAGLYFNVS